VGADGKLAPFATKASIPAIDGTYGPCPHALAISPDGKFLAAPLNSVTTAAAALAIWTINSDGTLSTTTGSPFPRTAIAGDIAWDASGRYLAIAAKDGLWIYSFAGTTPAPVGGGPIIAGPIDHLAFNKAGTLLFATNASAQKLYAFAINSSTGAATPAPGSPHTTSLAPYGLAMAER
jgi:6-phosphogluconolactonase (cycloisomerase 2 family)